MLLAPQPGWPDLKPPWVIHRRRRGFTLGALADDGGSVLRSDGTSVLRSDDTEVLRSQG